MPAPKPTRRDFLKAAGIGLAANSVAPVVQPLQRFAAQNQPLHVRVLVPASQIDPLPGQNFVAGMKTYLHQSDRPIDLSVLPYELAQAAQTAQKLIKTEQVDVVIALIGANLAERMRSIFEQAGILLIAADIGANAIRLDETSPYVIHHTLNLWESNWAIAAQAVRQFGQRMFSVASFYDSGYDSLYAAQLGTEYANGSMSDSVITHIQPGNNRIAATLASIRAAQPSFVFAHYSGQAAFEFLDAYAEAGLTREIPLVTSAFALHERVLAVLGDALTSVQSGITWSNALDGQANKDFTTSFRSLSGYAADPFALLGYDSVRLLDQAVTVTGSSRADRLALALRSTRLDSPRGMLVFDTETQTFSSPLYQTEVGYQGMALQNRVVGRLDAIPAQEILPKFAQGSSRSGWLHPYLSL